MKFLYTVRSGAVAQNYGGDLHLFFSTQNAQDWNPSSNSWLPDSLNGTIKLPNGASIVFAVSLVAGLPNQLYPYGTITVTTAQGQSFPPGPMGQETILFTPGTPAMTVWNGRLVGTLGGVTYDIGFALPVPWDGTQADCYGQWWALWHQ